MRRLGALLALTSLALCAAPATAGTPKRGTYIDTKLQVYTVVYTKTSKKTKKKQKLVKSMSGPCQRQLPDGTLQQYGGFLLPRTKRLKISKKGSFSYKGNSTVYVGSGKKVVKVSIKGRFSSSKKLTGTVSLNKAKTACENYKFNAKYYGVNPKG